MELQYEIVLIVTLIQDCFVQEKQDGKSFVYPIRYRHQENMSLKYITLIHVPDFSKVKLEYAVQLVRF